MQKGFLILMVRERLDKILTEKGFFETKSKAQAAIMAGDVKVNGIVITKSGYMLNSEENNNFEIKSMPFVSRGGFKLQKALQVFDINLKNRICLDAGASTGGFTDCMLQNGAKKVYSVDVGYGQISWKLRTDNRVKVIERINIKNCEFEDIYSADEPLADFFTMDLSFISITKVLNNIIKLAGNDGFEIVSLIKPQFEAGKNQVGKNGVVRDIQVHIEIVNNIINFCNQINLKVKNLIFSPIRGPKGNIEYLIHLADKGEANEINVNEIIEKANREI